MQQFSARLFPELYRSVPILAAAALLLSGCRKEEISSYSAPKDTTAISRVTAPAHPAHKASAPAVMHWTTPAGWEEQPASGMRIGSFSISKDGEKADVSIIPLAGISGSELDNVNRWRGQVGLEPVDAGKLAAQAEKVSIGSKPVNLYDMAGSDPQAKQPTRILAAILAAEGTTFFFKMTGNDRLVSQEKPAFKELLKSVEFQAHGEPTIAPDPHAAPPGQINPYTGVEEAAAEKPKWEVPAGWEEQPASSMRVASFLITGENGAKADLSVIKLAGMAGGILANVNRWRAQLGLEPVDEAGLEKLVTTREMNGSQVILSDMTGRSVESGEPARVLAAIVPRAGGTWFYKLVGNDQLVARQKAAFETFVQTARYPNVS